jgi:hypothetical protein
VLDTEVFTADLAQGLRVDSWGEDQNRNERHPHKRKEAEHQQLDAIEERKEAHWMLQSHFILRFNTRPQIE